MNYRAQAWIFCLLVAIAGSVQAQINSVDFGKNRVQYKHFEWSNYEEGQFSIYFYMGGQELGRYVAETAASNLEYVESKLEYHVSDHIHILIYNNVSDLRQNNIGVGSTVYNTGGMTKIIGNKIFIYFDGNHFNLERQIREGIARIIINDMMYGGNLQEAVQNAVLLNLPDWFIDGLVSYIGQEWSTEQDNQMRDGIISGRYQKFNKLTGMDARFAGHSMWYYIADKFGKSAVPNLLYLTRINRSLESGFLFVFSKSLKEAVVDWYDFYESIYSYELEHENMPDPENVVIVRPKKNWIYYNVALNPDGSHIAYVINHLGRYKVRITNADENKSKTIFRGGYKSVTRTNDFTMPLIAWSPNSKELAMVYTRKDEVLLTYYDLEAKKKVKTYLTGIQKVLSISYAPNSKKIVMSAINRGQSDIYMFHTRTRKLDKITNDFYDDLSPAYIKVEGKEGILWSSNRIEPVLKSRKLDSIPPISNFDIFFYDYKTKKKELIRVTNTYHVDETASMQYDNKHFSFLSDDNGITNRFVAYFDSIFSHYDTVVTFKDSIVTNPKLSPDALIDIPNDSILSFEIKDIYKDIAISFPITDYSRNIIEQDISPKAGKSLELMLKNGRYYIYQSKLDPELSEAKALAPSNTAFRRKVIANEKRTEDISNELDENKVNIDVSDSSEIDIYNYFFQDEFDTVTEPEIISLDTTKGERPDQIKKVKPSLKLNKSKFKPSKVHPYRITLSSDYVLSQLDNSIIFTKYQKYTAGGPVYETPPLNPLITLAISDLLEDYRFTGGFRFPTNLSGSEYFLTYEDLKHRLDKKVLFYRKSDLRSQLFENWFFPVNFKEKTHYFEGSVRWPITEIFSFRGYGAYRNEKKQYLGTDTFSINLPKENENWFMLKTEAVFDNTIERSLNLLEGTRFNLYFEAHKELSTFDLDSFKFGPKKSHSFVFGSDFRHYLKIHKNVIWANRVAFSKSFGPRRIVYYLGGVDNWIFPQVDQERIPSQAEADDQGYAFQALATNMRGFKQNVRHGSAVAVINSEIRFPIVTYFNLPLSGNFWKNLQIIGFGDIGTSWIGIHPFLDDNPLNTEIISQPPVTIKVNYFRNPVVESYGFGFRSTLLGYFVRFDIAYGIEDGVVNDAFYHLSLSLDF